jgi:hypothetical protein
MAKAIVSFLILFFYFTNSFGQTKIVSLSNIYTKKFFYPDETIALTNSANKQFAICFFRGKYINSYLFNEKNQVVDSLNSENKQREYKQIFGKTILANNEYVVFLSNKNRYKFASLNFSYSKGTIEFTELNLDLKNEKIIQTVDYNNTFHVLTVERKTSIVNVYKFENAENYIKIPIDFSDKSFVDSEDKQVTLYDLLTINSGIYGLGRSVDIAKIEVENPTSLEVACNPTKFYHDSDKVIISFDQNISFTQFVEINLHDYLGKIKQIEKPLSSLDNKEKDNNSFLHKDILYHITAGKRLLHLSAKDYNTGAIIQSHGANEHEEIGFKNSTIVQTGGTFDNYREFQQTSTLLRKIRRGKVGITVHEEDHQNRITFGGIIETKSNPSFVFPAFGIPIATIGAATIFINPSFFAFESYTNTKALTVEGLFDKDFQHKEGKLQENVFDRINKFEEDERISGVGRTLFSKGDEIILGSFNTFTRSFTLWSFTR